MAALLLAPVGVFSAAPADAQDCPRPAGLAANPGETPSPTAGEVIESGGSLLGAYTHLHAGFPDRFEFQKPTDVLRDEVTGDLILPQIIEVAQTPGGGFVTYHFDNPDDDGDSAGGARPGRTPLSGRRDTADVGRG